MPTEPSDMVPPTLELPRGRLVLFSVFAIASSVVIGVALHQALRHPKKHIPRHFSAMGQPTRASTALATLHRLADEAFALWHQEHPGATCPRTIEELASYTGSPIRGPYGGDAKFTFTCDPKLMPSGVNNIWLRDVGEDDIPNTADDLTSDMTQDDLE